MKISLKSILICVSILILQACSSVNTETKRSDINDMIYMPGQQIERELAESRTKGGSSVLGNLFGNSNKRASLQTQMSVNPYLWQASLEILSSTMPLSSVDSSSGIIITDWYNLKGKDNERIKISVLVSSQELRADGVKVSVFKQVLRSNTWKNVNVNPNIIQKLERKIIIKAGYLQSNNN